MICRAAGRTLVSQMGAQRIVRLGTGSPGCNDAVSCYSRCLLQVLAAATVHACSSVYCSSSSIVRVYRYDGIVIVRRMHSIDAVTNPTTLQLITPTSIYNVCTIDCGKSARLDIVALVSLAASKRR